VSWWGRAGFRVCMVNQDYFWYFGLNSLLCTFVYAFRLYVCFFLWRGCFVVDVRLDLESLLRSVKAVILIEVDPCV